jgi:hypothetical protein
MVYIRIRHAEDEQVSRLENLVSGQVISDLLLVNRPIDFDNNASGVTVKVYNKTVNHLLPTKMKTIELLSPEMFPELLLLWREFLAKGLGERHLALIYRLSDYDIVGRWHGIGSKATLFSCGRRHLGAMSTPPPNPPPPTGEGGYLQFR